MALGLAVGRYPFGHGREHRLDATRWLLDSYHCSRYNTATRRLTPAMFAAVLARACERAGLPLPRGPCSEERPPHV
jgi:uracil-DNA glycosylase